MSYRISAIDIFTREIPPPRIDFRIGSGQSLFPDWMRINLEVRLQLQSSSGKSSWGCSADWPSFGWLDKRSGIEPKQKLLGLLEFVLGARQVYLQQPKSAPMTNPFEFWWNANYDIFCQGKAAGTVPLVCSFAAALFERALIDAWCRLENIPFHLALRDDRLGFKPDWIHPELEATSLQSCLPTKPSTHVHIRHTVGLNDPLVRDDWPTEQHLDDGQPWALRDYVDQQGISYFKIKIGGDVDHDLQRLQRIWEVIRSTRPVITLDGNEAYDSVPKLQSLIERMASELPELFAHILLIEQPMNRNQTLDLRYIDAIEYLSKIKPLIIDEADGTLVAFTQALAVGYQGVSHKNCKGLFKSLAHQALCEFRKNQGASGILSAEDLTNLAPVALQQDFAVVSALGLTHAERNGHHFFYGLAHLTAQEKSQLLQAYPRLYHRQGDEVFLKIENGQVDLSDLVDCSGLGISTEPEWAAMTPLDDWLKNFRQAIESDA